MTVLDAHVHLWDPSAREYPWMAGLPILAHRFDVADLRRATRAGAVDRVLLVQAASDEAETRELLAVALQAPELVAGVVGWVDLTRPDVADRIAGLTAGLGGDRLVGVRHQVEDEAVDWLDDPAVRRGLRAVAAAGLVFDLLVRPEQLPSAVRAVDALPEGRYVLDHGAKPPMAGAGWDAWVAGVTMLSRRPSVTVKLSGLLTQLRADQPRSDAVAAGRLLLDLFGPERTAFGSDWPVSTLAGPYQDVVGFTNEVLAELAPTERAEVLAGTALRAYPRAAHASGVVGTVCPAPSQPHDQPRSGHGRRR